MKKKLILSCIVGFLLCLLSVIPIYASECSHVWETVYRIEPDCLSKGSEMKICQKCRKIETISLPVSDHPWGEWQITTAPNCTYTGIKTRTCTFCYKTQQEDVPTNGIHSWSDWKTATNICTEEKKAYRSCSYCHTQETTIIPASNHVWGEWYIDKKPTIFKTGVRMRYCINCLTEDKIIIPKQKMTTAQKQVKKSVDRFFKYAKQYNTSKLTKCFTKPSSVKLFIENSYMPQYYKKYNKRISYKLKSIKVSGKNATVKLSYKYPNRYNVFKAAFENSVYYQLKNPNISESQLLKYMYERICVHSKAGIDYSYGNLTLKLKKSGSAWKITSFNSKIDNLLHSDYTKAYNDYF